MEGIDIDIDMDIDIDIDIDRVDLISWQIDSSTPPTLLDAGRLWPTRDHLTGLNLA